MKSSHNKKLPSWAKIKLTEMERCTLAYCVLQDGQPTTPDDPKKARILTASLQRLRKKGIIVWNEDGVYLTHLGRYFAMRNPVTEPDAPSSYRS